MYSIIPYYTDTLKEMHVLLSQGKVLYTCMYTHLCYIQPEGHTVCEIIYKITMHSCYLVGIVAKQHSGRRPYLKDFSFNKTAYNILYYNRKEYTVSCVPNIIHTVN